MLRYRQEPEEEQAEVVHARRKWGWFRDRKADASRTEQAVAARSEADAIQPRLTALQEAIARRKKAAGMGRYGLAMLGSGALLLATLPGSGQQAWLVVGGEILLLTSLFRGEKAVRQAVNDLANTEELSAVGPLAEALMLGEPSFSVATAALTRLLPRMQPADAGLLTDAQRACLCRALRHSSNRLCFWRYNPHFAGVIRHALTTLAILPPGELTDRELLPQQPPGNVEGVVEQLQAAVRRRQKNGLITAGSAAVAATSSVANIVHTMLTQHQSFSPLLAIAVGSTCLTLSLSFRGLFRVKAMMNEVANSGDLRVVGPLIELAAIPDGSANWIASFLLTRLLPRLRSSDAALLTDGQHEAFGRALTRNASNPDFVIAAIKALEQLGDGRTLAVVDGLATGRIATADPRRVQAAARECLPFLQARYDQQRAIQTLLRPSLASETPPGSLLRPAQGAGTQGDADLLRPGFAGADTPPSDLSESSIIARVEAIRPRLLAVSLQMES